jgi:hypothetical protein
MMMMMMMRERKAWKFKFFRSVKFLYDACVVF